MTEYTNMPYYRPCYKCKKTHNCNRERKEQNYKGLCEQCEQEAKK